MPIGFRLQSMFLLKTYEIMPFIDEYKFLEVLVVKLKNSASQRVRCVFDVSLNQIFFLTSNRLEP